jgi:hypothetical protein
MSLETIGSIATFIVENLGASVPAGVSGNMVEIVDMARQHVENYVGTTIGSNSIAAKYQPAIIDFAKADTIDLINATGDIDEINLAELKSVESDKMMSAEQYRMLGEMKLKSLGRAVQVVRSLS